MWVVLLTKNIHLNLSLYPTFIIIINIVVVVVVLVDIIIIISINIIIIIIFCLVPSVVKIPRVKTIKNYYY